jgi:hypothetical protein
MAVLAVSYASSTRAWLRQRSEINTLTAQIADQQAQVDALEKEKRRWKDPAYIRMQATSRFGWVMPGETGYRVIGDNGEVLDNGMSSLSEPVPPDQGVGDHWWDDAWGSVLAAGAEPTQPTTRAKTEDDPAAHIDKDGSTTSPGHGGGQAGKPSDGRAGSGHSDGSGQTGQR